MHKDEHFLEDFLAIVKEKRHSRKYSKKVSMLDLLYGQNFDMIRRLARKYIPCQNHEIPFYADLCGKCSCHYWAEYKKIRDSAFFAIFGRAYNTSDYQVSGICRNEFDKETKDKLREYVQKAQNFEQLGKIFSLIPKYSKS